MTRWNSAPEIETVPAFQRRGNKCEFSLSDKQRGIKDIIQSSLI
jgi:hypothetical protein